MPITAAQAERTRRGIDRWCGRAETTHDLLRGVAQRLQPILAYDTAAWLVTDPATVLFTDGYIEHFPEATCAPWFDHELHVDDVMKFRDVARRRVPSATLAEELDGDLAISARWRNVLVSIGLGDELRGAFRDGAGCWGVVSLHREGRDAVFDASERDLLAELSPIVANGIRATALRQEAQRGDVDGPGLIVIDADGTVRPGTDAGAVWLDLLTAPAPDYGAATGLRSLRALMRGGDDGVRRVRLQTRDGRWVTLHGSPMSAADGAVAVIVEPARPADVAGFVARAYGLSPREREVALAVARGDATAEIADGLFISTHTVRDHLKSIYAKTGVASRGELVARLFHDHYAERVLGATHGG